MQIEWKQVFSRSPDEFEISSRMTWEPPCEIHANLYLRPKGDKCLEDFCFPLIIPFRIDAFSKTLHEEQLQSGFWSVQELIHDGPNFVPWMSEFNKWNPILKEQLQHPDKMFQHPFRFVGREKFLTTDLPTVLNENPERMDLYLADDEGSYTDYCVLRIHSSLLHFIPEAQHLWFEKRLPSELQIEDILPWFMATIRRLPKKSQPSNIQKWQERLLRNEPKLVPPTSGKNKPWASKPKVILVFGATHKVGYRSLFHLERPKIDRIVRQQEILTVSATIQYGNKPEQAHDWTFYLLTSDEAAACRVEQEIIVGEKIHFGLDQDIIGMVARAGHVIHVINVSIERVSDLCLKDNEALENILDPRNKHKVYCIKQNLILHPTEQENHPPSP